MPSNVNCTHSTPHTNFNFVYSFRRLCTAITLNVQPNTAMKQLWGLLKRMYHVKAQELTVCMKIAAAVL
jgi:hypothetical protein